MNIIPITKPDFFEGETDIVNNLFADSLQRLHLRKPEATRKRLAEWIERIEPTFRNHIVLHDHYRLAVAYGLGGIHLNSRNPDVPDWLERNRFSLSRSCHTIEEVKTMASDYDYVFLSPIFDSISKQGYKAAFTRAELTEIRAILSQNVYALGGITFDNLKEVEQLGFCGAAMLGGFWEKPYP